MAEGLICAAAAFVGWQLFRAGYWHGRIKEAQECSGRIE